MVEQPKDTSGAYEFRLKKEDVPSSPLVETIRSIQARVGNLPYNSGFDWTANLDVPIAEDPHFDTEPFIPHPEQEAQLINPGESVK